VPGSREDSTSGDTELGDVRDAAVARRPNAGSTQAITFLEERSR
jgi:hypothetical protein